MSDIKTLVDSLHDVEKFLEDAKKAPSYTPLTTEEILERIQKRHQELDAIFAQLEKLFPVKKEGL
jgi:hypothetical protein